MSMILQFPAEHPVLDEFPLDARTPAPAPTLMPGQPPPPLGPPPGGPTEQDQRRPQRKKAAAVVGAIATVVAVVTTVALVATAQNGAPTASPGGDQTSNTTESTENTPDSTISSMPSPVPTDENSAQQVLESQVANDRSQVEALTGYWVPQLSSKRFGLVANGTTYGYGGIWSDFTSLRARYPGAMLLWSGDYSSFRLTDFWVTIAPQSYGSGEAANDWCASAGIGKDDCYAKRISHTDGYAESTLLRK
jgi:serine/threonine-protein kinase